MKAFVVFVAVLIGALCTYSTARPSSNRNAEIEKLLSQMAMVKAQNLMSQDMMFEPPDDALAQLYLSLLKKEVQRQGFSEEDRAKIESIFDSIKNTFTNFGKKIKNGFTSFGEKVKNFFHGR